MSCQKYSALLNVCSGRVSRLAHEGQRVQLSFVQHLHVLHEGYDRLGAREEVWIFLVLECRADDAVDLAALIEIDEVGQFVRVAVIRKRQVRQVYATVRPN